MENEKRREKFLRLPEVEARTALKKSTIYARMRAVPPTFPLCVRQGRSVAWPETRIDAYMESVITASTECQDQAPLLLVQERIAAGAASHQGSLEPEVPR